MKKIKTLGILLLTLFIIMSTAVIGYANEELITTSNEEELLENVLVYEYSDLPMYPRATSNLICSLDFVKTSSTQASAKVSALAQKYSDTITSIITLQKYSATEGKYVDTAAAPASQSVKNPFNIIHKATFRISSGDYRIKVTFKVKVGGTTTSNVFYKKMT